MKLEEPIWVKTRIAWQQMIAMDMDRSITMPDILVEDVFHERVDKLEQKLEISLADIEWYRLDFFLEWRGKPKEAGRGEST